MNTQNQKLADWLKSSKHAVFFGGAGVSTESGVPDFRSATGIYQKHLGAETILTPHYLEQHPEEYYHFYREYFMMKGIQPNACHRALAELEQMGLIKAVITQNVDGLHQLAGSKRVIELHGSGQRFYCARCRDQYSFEEVDAMDLVPRCSCGGLIRSDIVLYTEGLNERDILAAVSEIEQADLLIVGGTSLTVYPAAGLVSYQRNGRLAVVNQGKTGSDRAADLLIRDPIGQVFGQVMELIKAS